MKKIKTIFKRNPENMREILPEVTPGCEWVFEGEGVATRKYDGSCCMVRDGKLYKRREVKEGKQIPADFEEEDFDKNTGKRFGWVPVTDSPEDKYHNEAFCPGLPDGTYELLGPKIQRNMEGEESHRLQAHSEAQKLEDCPREFDSLALWFKSMDIEGVVWHHPDGRMAKIKLRDFGVKRAPFQGKRNGI